MGATESKRTSKLEKGKGENRVWCGRGRQSPVKGKAAGGQGMWSQRDAKSSKRE